MAIAEKYSELQQRHEKLVAELRDITGKISKEKRTPTPEEDERLIAINGKGEGDGGELMALRIQMGSMSRALAAEKIGFDPRSGQDPLEMRHSNPLPHEDPGNTRNGQYSYSLLRAASCFLQGNTFGGLEKEVSDELVKRSGKNPHSFMMPYRNATGFAPPLSFAEIDRQRRLLDHKMEIRATGTLDSGAAAGSIPTILAKDWIDMLRNQLAVMRAGATEITDLTGKFAIPRQSQAATGYWVGEGGAPTASNQVLDQILFSPHTVGAFTDVTRRVFELSNIASMEGFVQSDLTQVISRAVDLAAFNGTGAGGQPLGICQNTGVTGGRTMSLGTNGGVPTWAAMVELQTIVNRSNAGVLGPFTYVSNADVRGTLATTPKIGSTFPTYLLADDGTIFTTPVVWSQQVPFNLVKGASGATLSMMIGGIWNQMILAYWSGIDVMVDPYTGSSTGSVRIVALQDMDIQVRHNEAFSFIFDMVTNQSQ